VAKEKISFFAGLFYLHTPNKKTAQPKQQRNFKKNLIDSKETFPTALVWRKGRTGAIRQAKSGGMIVSN